MFTSEQLTEGDIYTREYLSRQFNIKDATLKTGIFQPPGYQSIWLFVTENKTKGFTPYKNLLHEDTLEWDGQTMGRKDRLIIEHETKDLEILVFYRTSRRAISHGGFKYEGQFHYVKHTGSHPTHFTLQRVASKPTMTKNGVEASEIDEAHEEDRPYANLTNKHEQNSKREKTSVLMEQTKQFRLVYCYARKDKALRDELDKHLSVLKHKYLITWFDHEISPGTEWEKEIDAQLNAAHIILLLVSPDFMDSKYCYGVEMRHAIERHERGEARVIPVILRPIGWQDTPIGKLQALPRNGKPVVDRIWGKRDYALHNVAEGLKEVVNQLTSISLAPLALSSHTTLPYLGYENGQDPIIFKHKEQGDAYRKWVLAHREDGLIVVQDGPKWKLHTAICHHIIDQIDKGKSLLTYPKICSTSRPRLDEEARKRGGTISTGCYCQR